MGPHTISEAQALSKTHPRLQHTLLNKAFFGRDGQCCHTSGARKERTEAKEVTASKWAR